MSEEKNTHDIMQTPVSFRIFRYHLPEFLASNPRFGPRFLAWNGLQPGVPGCPEGSNEHASAMGQLSSGCHVDAVARSLTLFTLPKTNIAPIKMVVSNRNFLFKG